MEQRLSRQRTKAKAKELINKLLDIIKNGEVRDLGNGKVRIVTENYSVGMKKKSGKDKKKSLYFNSF